VLYRDMACITCKVQKDASCSPNSTDFSSADRDLQSVRHGKYRFGSCTNADTDARNSFSPPLSSSTTHSHDLDALVLREAPCILSLFTPATLSSLRFSSLPAAESSTHNPRELNSDLGLVVVFSKKKVRKQ
jgi:hypothetical protein